MQRPRAGYRRVCRSAWAQVRRGHPDQEGQVPGASSSGTFKIFTEEVGRKHLLSGERDGVGGKEEGRISGYLT